QWRLQGSEIGGATGSTYFVPDVQAQNVGAYDVVITNLGGAVTSSPALLAFPPAPVLVSPRIGSNGHFSFTITGSAGYNFEVQATTNFSNWNVLGTLSNGNGAVPFADTNLPARAFRGYRARLIP
ncbi:MAG TPA: hypothetical protein VHH88_02815, partial [Verrucomicrobiae bacterium]|nr:hypothetical protein [Verrucomicrobiae bacterium]